MATATYRDPAQPVEARIEDLLARMTLPEKVGQLLQLDARGDIEDVVSVKQKECGGNCGCGHAKTAETPNGQKDLLA